MTRERYTRNFYETLRPGALSSARAIVPLVMDWCSPKSVVDVGCGLGTWLKVFEQHGVSHILGVDGDHLDEQMLHIPVDRFRATDLSKPFSLDERFDLVVSLEVAEHLRPECAETFVDSLVRLGPVVLFSAAVPRQGGEEHVNEQWPSYWSRLFEQKGYLTVDSLRPALWSDSQVEWWYAQNILLLCQAEGVKQRPAPKSEDGPTVPLSLVHPGNYLDKVEKLSECQRQLWRCQCELIEIELHRLLPADASFILVDEGRLKNDLAGELRPLPFLEREGEFAGLPADDQTAVAEVERHRERGVRYVVFAWPAFWCLDYYTELCRYLETGSRCLFRNDQLIVYELGPKPPSSAEY